MANIIFRIIRRSLPLVAKQRLTRGIHSDEKKQLYLINLYSTQINLIN
ncbi:MAG TPA: hypothetical protein VMC48_03100 [Methanobacterium sp.]|nr:hypothetical protein [Methanobacterium sp.]